jgi:hypothetical protein
LLLSDSIRREGADTFATGDGTLVRVQKNARTLLRASGDQNELLLLIDGPETEVSWTW